MTGEKPLEEQLEAANHSLKELEAELQACRKQIASMLSLLERQQARLVAHDASIARLDRILMGILTGRTWRALQTAGKLAKRIFPGRSGNQQLKSPGLLRGQWHSYLVCDEPLADDPKPRSGKVVVRGWCLAPGGVEAVQAEIPGLPPVKGMPNIARPDVKKAHPDLDLTGRAGFAIEIDSRTLPKGKYPVTIQVVSQGTVVREEKTEVRIDHEAGFVSEYAEWIHDFEQPDDEMITLKLMNFERRSLFSIVMPVYNTEPAELTEAIQSVIEQSYSNWELCIADDASSRPEIKEILDRFAKPDSRIRVVYRSEQGGISAATNSALEISTGDYVCFLDHDDRLSKHALAYICEALSADSEADFLYSDEDKIDQNGERFEPFFKPEWSPDLLLSENYIGHLLVLRRQLIQKIGGFQPRFDGSQDFDLVLRASEHATRIVHIPRVLYHWRAGATSTASHIDHKEYALKAAQEALEDHCERFGIRAEVEPGIFAGRWRLRYAIPEGTRVSIIIASGGNAGVLRTNLLNLFGKTTYRDFEVVVIDNSKHHEIEKLVKGFNSGERVLRYIGWRNKPFNYSQINNEAARQCASPILLFLNDDTSAIAPDWLTAMVELIARPEVGVVGAKLLYPDGRIQHAGVAMGIYDNCGHAFKGLDGSTAHYFGFADVIRNVSAVTGACLMTKADVFQQVHGFDETKFSVAFNDIDLCLKIGRLGYRVLYTPHALLYHHEAFSKTPKDLVPHPDEVAAMREKWRAIIEADPFYSPNLTQNDENYAVRTRF